MTNWYYLVNGQQEGPVPQEELLQKFAGGELPADTFIWSKGMKDWLKAGEIDGFLNAAQEQPAAVASALTDDDAAAPAAETAPSKGRLSLAKKEAPEEKPQPAGEDASGAPAGVTAPVIGQQFQPATQAEAAYLYISPFRLIFMSIFSFGIYEIYWIYKNWRYAKERDGLDIWPFWRGWFGIFHCHSLLRYIHMDKVLTRWQQPTFKPGTLATIWVIMKIIENITLRSGSEEVTGSALLGPFWPSFLCFLPVQLYINKVNKEMAPEAPKTSCFTVGHIIITVFSLFLWAALLAAVFIPEEVIKQLSTQ